jgi:transcriptional antiterminator NusG
MAKGWYVVHTQSGYEDRVKRMLENKMAESSNGRIHQIFIPTEEVVEVKRNKRAVKKRKFFPGYLLVDLDIDNETYWLIRNIQGVTGFLGDPKPAPLPAEEIQEIFALTTSAQGGKPKPAIQFEKGETVRINDGPFRHFVGVVEDVNEPKAKLKAMVTIFGRPTPVELDFLQVEKL